jgi:hypothetical protein
VSREFLADVELFVRGEHEGLTSKGIGFEVSFGRPLDAEDDEPLARREPAAIELGGGLTFRVAGRIDRINQVADGFEVLDYKTGGFWRDDYKGVFNGGRRLQHALCGLAAVELLRAHYKNPQIASSLYYFSSQKGRQEQVRIKTPSLNDTRKVLTPSARSSWMAPTRTRRTKRTASSATTRLPATRRCTAGRAARCRTSRWSPTGGLPSMSDTRSMDAESRRIIREELLTNILVEAGAGSGKTQMLAERMAAGVASGVYRIEHLAAVTFTRKAASELRGRFHLALGQPFSQAARNFTRQLTLDRVRQGSGGCRAGGAEQQARPLGRGQSGTALGAASQACESRPGSAN